MIVILKAKLPYLATFAVLQDLLLAPVNSCLLDLRLRPVRGLLHLRVCQGSPSLPVPVPLTVPIPSPSSSLSLSLSPSLSPFPSWSPSPPHPHPLPSSRPRPHLRPHLRPRDTPRPIPHPRRCYFNIVEVFVCLLEGRVSLSNVHARELFQTCTVNEPNPDGGNRLRLQASLVAVVPFPDAG